MFYIGDGMGFEQVSAAGCYLGQPLPFEVFPYQAECTTYSASSSVTDSAAAGTALATGFKVNDGVVSMAYPGDHSELLTLLEEAQANGKSVGLISTCYLTHATPACFGAHEPSRNNLSSIAGDYLNQTRPNVLFGGGGNGLTVSDTVTAGYTVVTDSAGFSGLDTSLPYISAQFGSTHMPYKYDYLSLEYPYPLLNAIVQKALEALEDNENGFFLMVEGGRIDHACHDNNLQRCIHETIDFSESVQVGINWAAGRTDTLILVTADHETGGLTVVQDNGPDEYPDVTWSTGSHTGTNVPVYAWGQNSELVSGVMDNTDMFYVCTADTSVPQATNPNPKDGATEVALDTPLTWSSGAGAVYHNVYMGTDSENLPEVAHQITDTEYYTGPWDDNTLYYWRVDEVDSSEEIVEGELWSFTTTYAPDPITNPYPANGASDVILNVQLSWDAGARAVNHQVYFGEDPANLPMVSEQTETTYSPQNLSNLTTYHWQIIERNSAGSAASPVYSFTTEAEPQPEKFYATGENTVRGTLVSGDYVSTHASDDSYEIFQEVINVPNRNGYSTLEHVWTFDIGSSSSAEFYVEGYHSPSSDGDDFVFSYSTDGETYVDMITLTKTEDTDAPQVYAFSSNLSGTVYIKVTDLDHTKKNQSLDTLYVDQIYILASAGTIKHYQAINPSPADGSTDVSLDIILSWHAGDDAISHNVYFSADMEYLTFIGNQPGTSYTPYHVDPLTTYYWRIDEVRDGAVAEGHIWSFTTTYVGECIPATMTVDSTLTDTVRGDKGQEYGRATVTIVDNCGNPVSEATVTGSFTGDFTEQMVGMTNDSGIVVFVTSAQMKKPSFGFIVENVTHAELEY
jgi:alkaline phosphatase